MLQVVPRLAKAPDGFNTVKVSPMCGALGAEVTGVDLSKPLSNECFADIQKALRDYLVIFFRDQDITPDQHKKFGLLFGTLNVHPVYEPLEGHPEILQVVKEADALNNIGDTWHSDATFLENPPMGSILYAREIPPFGGDTLFANLELAYEMLSDGMKKMLNGMQAVHSDAFLTGANSERNATRSTKLRDGALVTREVVHPVVRTHPETGRKSLYINEPFTVRFDGMTEKESRPLLDYLLGHIKSPEFTCRFRWQVGSMAFWDNRCTHHYALNDYHGHRREMHRVTVNGDRPF
ncbi:TauD/TfdA dioxygenase family protein [Hwanghaeella sp.]|uniref:TauD/TfdA dioxygenase family protein n=1 Tax=Hwanghaeella sp. TaxID=2605943 RepID=UPI003CCBF773